MCIRDSPRAAHCPAHGLCWTLGLHGLLRRWPRVGRPMGQGELASFAGKPSTKGHHRAALWSIQGDAESYSNFLKVGRWASQYPCCMPSWQVSQDIESIRARLQICEPSRGTPCQKEQSCTLWNPWCFNSYDQGLSLIHI